MKKHKFYSMVREEGAVIAKLHEGYTDGTYNYYRKDKTWYVIHPINGLSIFEAYTRKWAAEYAHSPAMVKRIAAALERQQNKADKFAELVKAAERGAA